MRHDSEKGPDPGEQLDDAGDVSIRDERSATEGDLPTMQLCAKAINARIEDRERRFRSLDSKAGLILGFDGLIVGFASNVVSPGDVALAGQAASAFSGLLAAIVLVCRRGAVALEPQGIEELATLPPWDALSKIIGTAVWAYDTDEVWLKVRTRLLLASVTTLVAALGLLVVGTGLRLA